jgi:hypothetical protein
MRLLFVCLLFTVNCSAQEVINIDGVNCGIHGSSKSGSKTYYLNEFKNRFSLPDSNAIDPTISISDLLNSGNPDQFDQNKAVTIQGYVFNVKTGGVETCNCKTKDPAFRDTHIEITPDENHTDPQYRIIVEVTPRMREIMATKGMNWSTTELHGLIKGLKVEVTGWLFYDAEHEDASFANDPDDVIGRSNWRGSCWEIHPITSITVLRVTTNLNDQITKPVNGNSGITPNKPSPETTATTTKTPSSPSLPAQPEETNHAFVYILGILFLIALVIIILLITRWNKSS